MPVYNGTAYADMIAGDQFGVADDIIFGFGGNDVLSGLDGADRIEGGSGNDSLDGGAGIDTLSYASALARIAVDLAIVGAQSTVGAGIDSVTGFENIAGSAYDDTLSGNEIANLIEGGQGKDRLAGRVGDDTLDGQAGDDVLDGGAGADTLIGGDGFDWAGYASSQAGVTVDLAVQGATQDTGGAGIDTLMGIEGIVGSDMADQLSGDGGANQLLGGLGDDALAGGDGDDLLDGGGGTDLVRYATAAAAVTINLLSQSAQNTGAAGIDTLRSIENVEGSAFGDTLTGNAFGNLLAGGLGNDVLNGGLGNDRLEGGDGIDTATYANATGAIRVNLALIVAQSTISAGSDTLTGIENVTGSGYDDQLTGDAGDNMLVGNGGNDLLAGGLGNDLLSGGAGTDTASYAAATAGVSVNLGLTTAQDTGGAGIDTLLFVENLTGSAYADTLIGSTQVNILLGGAGNDSIDGAGANDVLDGGAGDDIIQGGNGNDHLTGGVGNDQVHGGAGDDFFVPGGGNDLFDGGTGFDTVDYSAAAGRVLIRLSGPTGLPIAPGQGYDTLVDIDHIIAGAFGDELIGKDVGGGTATAPGATLEGRGGDDRIASASRGVYDTLIGGDGNDYLSGDSGDTLIGGAGDDRYNITIYSAVVPSLYEAPDEGHDVIFAWASPVDFIMPENFEDFRFSSAADGVNVDGNALDNLIEGSWGDSIFNGLGGNDALIGSRGIDILSGGEGADRFIYTSLLDSNAELGIDRIMDLTEADMIDLSAIDASSNGSYNEAFSLVTALTGTAGELAVVFDAGTDTTSLLGDVDGDAIADLIIHVTGDVRSLATDWIL
ncbi:Ca2+-binding RTX toxin-like protein [Sphingomonas zeicaulis]|uniref:calcium-binding protein n=1 Tax=Sphingomonas zeicaulis TaxID=1632740 RepID=UPI003D1BDCC9